MRYARNYCDPCIDNPSKPPLDRGGLGVARSTANYITKKEILTYLLSAVWTRLELATPCVTGRYSNQLNYHTVLLCLQVQM